MRAPRLFELTFLALDLCTTRSPSRNAFDRVRDRDRDGDEAKKSKSGVSVRVVSTEQYAGQRAGDVDSTKHVHVKS